MKSGDEILMGKIMKVVNEHLDDPTLNVEMLASEVGLSRVHVHRKLKELTNLSTRDFIKNIRLQQAATLLAQDHKLTVSETDDSGNSRPTWFSRSVVFRKVLQTARGNVAERVYEPAPIISF